MTPARRSTAPVSFSSLFERMADRAMRQREISKVRQCLTGEWQSSEEIAKKCGDTINKMQVGWILHQLGSAVQSREVRKKSKQWRTP